MDTCRVKREEAIHRFQPTGWPSKFLLLQFLSYLTSNFDRFLIVLTAFKYYGKTDKSCYVFPPVNQHLCAMVVYNQQQQHQSMKVLFAA